MNSKQIVHAIRHRLPVMYDGKRYDRILEYVLWFDNQGKQQLSVVLILKNGSIRVPADKVSPVEE